MCIVLLGHCSSNSLIDCINFTLYSSNLTTISSSINSNSSILSLLYQLIQQSLSIFCCLNSLVISYERLIGTCTVISNTLINSILQVFISCRTLISNSLLNAKLVFYTFLCIINILTNSIFRSLEISSSIILCIIRSCICLLDSSSLSMFQSLNFSIHSYLSFLISYNLINRLLVLIIRFDATNSCIDCTLHGNIVLLRNIILTITIMRNNISLHILDQLLNSFNSSITVGQAILIQLSLFAFKLSLQALNLSISSFLSIILNLSQCRLIFNKVLNFSLSICNISISFFNNSLKINLLISFNFSISSFYILLCSKEQTILRIQVCYNLLLPIRIGRSRESLDNILKLFIIFSLCFIKGSNYAIIASLIIIIIKFSLLNTCHQILNI